jgi:hypothetical protein
MCNRTYLPRTILVLWLLAYLPVEITLDLATSLVRLVCLASTIALCLVIGKVEKNGVAVGRA